MYFMLQRTPDNEFKDIAIFMRLLFSLKKEHKPGRSPVCLLGVNHTSWLLISALSKICKL